MHHTQDAKGTELSIQVEYDVNFWGGNYSGVGNFALIKLTEINGIGGVKAAFRESTGIDPVHIIHYSFDDLYDDEGDLVDR